MLAGFKTHSNIFCLFSLLFFVFLTTTFAQQKLYELNLSKDNISWFWQGRLFYDQQVGGQNRFFLKNNFNSNLFRERSEQNKWKDENDLDAGWERPLSGAFSTTFKIRSHVFSDENAFVKFSKHLLLQEVKYSPSKKIAIAPAFGWASEDIYSYRDQGWYAQIDADVHEMDFSGYTNSTDIFSSVYFFGGRRNQDHHYYIAFDKQFSDYARDSIRVGYEFTQNAYHLARENQLENVEINSRFLFNLIKYKLGDFSDFEVETKLQKRDISQSNPSLLNHREEINLANKVSINRKGERLQSGIAFLSSQNTNLASRTSPGGSESRNDIEGLQAALNFFTNWKISESDETRLNFSYTKYEYSSPDSTQNIDEDDLRFITDLTYMHRFSPYFRLMLKGNIYLYHQIYIHASRSANNNWNRIFQIGPSLHFKLPGVLQHTNRFKLLANYTVYDFDEILPQVRSYIFRKFIYTDSLSINLSGGLQLVTMYQLEKEDDGTFFKNIFAQQVSRELTSHFIDLSLVYVRLGNIQFTTGINWYIRREWSFFPQHRMTRDYRAVSPRISVIYNTGSKILLYVTFAPRTYHDINIERQTYATGKVNLKYLF